MITSADTPRHSSNRRHGFLGLSPEDQRHLSDLERQFDLLRDRTRCVAERYQNFCYIVGRSGAGKTHVVRDTLRRLKSPHVCYNSRMSPFGFFCVIEEHPEHTIVLDDIPCLLKQPPQALQILMAATGGEPGERRVVTYTTKDERKSVDFTGGIIAISNVPLGRDPLTDAVASRAVQLQHEPTDEQLAAFMRHLSLQGHKKDMEPAQCLEVVEFVILESRKADYRLNLRFMTQGWQDYRMWMHGMTIRLWQELVESSIRRIVNPPPSSIPTKQDEIQVQLDLVRRLLLKYPGDVSKQLEESGLKKSTFYSRKRQVEAGL